MILNNSYVYEIQEIEINRDGLKQPYSYYQLRIKHRSDKNTIIVFTQSIRNDNPNAFEDLLELAKKMKKIY
jgi:hypothetical protein